MAESTLLAPAPDSSPAPTDWRAALPEDLRAEKSLADFKGDDWTAVGPALAKSFVETKRLVGGSLRVPGADAKPEEVAAFHKALGVPESPDKYDAKLPAFPAEMGITLDPGRVQSFLAIAHKHGAPPSLVQAVLDWYGQDTLGQVDAMTRAKGEAKKTAAATLRQEWAGAYDRNMGLARGAVRTLFADDPEISQAVIDAGNNPALLKGLVRIGELLHEQGEIRGDDVPGGRTEQELEAAILAIKTAPNAENDPTAADRILALTRELMALRARGK